MPGILRRAPLLDVLLEGLDQAAIEIARRGRRYWRARHRRRRGATLRPGIDTPHWLALAAAVRPHLRRRGNKALLARELGLDPSRITEFFVRRSAMPDAERTLLLLQWLSRGRQRR